MAWLRGEGCTTRAGILCALAVVVVVGVVPDARAEPTKHECIQANESAQVLRKKQALAATRAQLLQCVARSCPAPVRADCVERLDEVERATPTLVLVAKDAAGDDLSDVRVSLDGAPLATVSTAPR